jgi:hypothetical protein
LDENVDEEVEAAVANGGVDMQDAFKTGEEGGDSGRGRIDLDGLNEDRAEQRASNRGREEFNRTTSAYDFRGEFQLDGDEEEEEAKNEGVGRRGDERGKR